MKIFTTALLLAFILTSFGLQQRPTKNEFKSNFAALYDNLYIGKYEVSNNGYKQFLKAQKEVLSPADFNILEADPQTFSNQDPKLKPFDKYYFEHIAYEDYPVVGISHAAANAYCDWLTEEYANERVKGKKIKFSLPTKAAWQYAGNSGNTTKQYSWGTGFTKNNRGIFLANFKTSSSDVNDRTKLIGASDRIYITSPVNSFFPSKVGVYNLCGNVAEMLDEKGIAAGGSFLSEPFEITLTSFENYESPNVSTGFRVMASLY